MTTDRLQSLLSLLTPWPGFRVRSTRSDLHESIESVGVSMHEKTLTIREAARQLAAVAERLLAPELGKLAMFLAIFGKTSLLILPQFA